MRHPPHVESFPDARPEVPAEATPSPPRQLAHSIGGGAAPSLSSRRPSGHIRCSMEAVGVRHLGHLNRDSPLASPVGPLSSTRAAGITIKDNT